MPPPVRGSLELGGQNVLLPRGSLAVSEARELIVRRSLAGAYEADGTQATDTLRKLGSGGLTLDRLPSPPTDEEVVRVYDEAVVWGGQIGAASLLLMDPYGHFLIESTARLWPLLPGGPLEGLPVVLTAPRGPAPPYVEEWLRAFGARTVELPERGAVRFTRMLVPEPAWQVDAWIAPEIRDIHLHARRKMSTRSPSGHGGVLWLSRSGLERVPADEDLLESLLDEHVTVVNPESMALAEQVAALESCRAVAGVIGSAFHTLLLTTEPPECLYLCPPWDREAFPAQHRLLDAPVTFAEALEVAALTHREREEGIDFPRGYRLVIPEALRALGATVLPALSEDPKAATLTEAEGTPSGAPAESRAKTAGSRTLGGQNVLLPRGSLAVSEARELIVSRTLAGAYEADGTQATDTLRAVGERAFRLTRLPPGPADGDIVDVDDEKVVWGGHIAPAYGHFLIESTARLWPLLPGGPLEGLPVVLTAPQGPAPPYVEEWLRAFGARTVELPERGAVRFTRMLVPEPAWRMGAWIAPEIRDIHLHAREGLEVPSVDGQDVLWLSRSRLTSGRVPYDEGLLEWLLDGHVTVVNPESMALTEQVAALESCRAVAGVIGSAFHTLLLTTEPPECLYLCPPWDKGDFPAQHWLLDTTATFAQTLKIASWTQRMRREGISFPRGYRVLVPEALRALSATLLPDLLEDPRLAAFADPERQLGGGGLPEDQLDAAAARVLLDPLSIDARMELGALFEAEGLAWCAREQLAAVADLKPDPSPEYARD